MGYRIGSGYFGSDNIKISTANQEIIQQHKPITWSIPLKALKLTFKPYQDCHIKINGGDAIFWEANEALNTTFEDAPIESLVIVESGISYMYFFEY